MFLLKQPVSSSTGLCEVTRALIHPIGSSSPRVRPSWPTVGGVAEAVEYRFAGTDPSRNSTDRGVGADPDGPLRGRVRGTEWGRTGNPPVDRVGLPGRNCLVPRLLCYTDQFSGGARRGSVVLTNEEWSKG